MGYSDAYPGGYGEGTGDVITSVYLETDPDTWYEITGQLISGSTVRGRQHQLDRYQAGVCNLLLDNDDRTFDPNHGDSPLAGHILPMKRVKVTATWEGVTYPLFLGYTDRWIQNREGPHRGTTSLEATDGFKLLARANLAASSYAQEVSADGPVAWWRFDEAGGTVARDSIGDKDLAALGAPELGTDTLIARDPGASMTTADPGDGLYRTGQFPVTTGPLSLECVVRLTTETNVAIAGCFSETAPFGVGFVLNADDATGFEIAKTIGTGVGCASTVDYTDGATHHIVCVWEADGDLKIYVDGVDRTSGTPNLAVGSFANTTGFTFVGANPQVDGALGVYDEVAIYDYALTAARVAAHAEAVATPWDGDLSGERIERVLDAVSWPDDLRDIDDGLTTLQPAELDMTALEHAQVVAETEAGNLYVTGAGVVRFEERTSTVNQPAAFAFSDAAGSDLPITFSNPELSDDQIRNVVTVSRLDGIAQTAQDDTSIAAYQISSYTRDGLYHDDDEHSRYLADFILQAYKDPVERVSQMAVNPYRDPENLWPAVLGLELTDRVTLEETPQWTGDPVTRTLVVEGVTHTFGPKQWDASFNLSENAAAITAYWELGVAGLSELGETTRVYF